MNQIMEQIDRGLEAYGLKAQVSPAAAQELDMYSQLLLEKNQVMNLTAITDPAGVANLHMLDCAALLLCADFTGEKRLLDVGTGAGFPGMVLKILQPALDVTLLDSLNKRLDWLTETCGALSLQNIRTVHARAEEQAHEPGFRESFDFVTSRAVAPLNILCELCLPYVKLGGRLLAMKSVDSGQELSQAQEAIRRLGGQALPPFDYTIPGTEITHRVILVEKTEPTPKQFPRRWAKLQKAPL